MAYTLSNKCAKNCCKRTILLQVIIEDVITCFFETQCSCTWICPLCGLPTFSSSFFFILFFYSIASFNSINALDLSNKDLLIVVRL